MSLKFIHHQEPQHFSRNDYDHLKNDFQSFLKNHPRKEIFFPKDRTEKLRNALVKKFEDKRYFVHIGMGGSSLGPETFIKSLFPVQTEREFLFLNNIDSDELHAYLQIIDLKNSLFYVVSKSGGTIETLSLLAIIDQQLINLLGNDYDRSQFFVFCTDPEKSFLLDLGKQWEVNCLEIATNVGGRYSVLTDAGLFPLAMAKIDSKSIIETHQKYSKELENSEELFSFAFEVFAQYKKNKTQTVLMPYSSLLKPLSLWFVQLWAESLGKMTEQGPKGLTPLFAYGPTDQHSQMQLFMDGPADKLLLFIEVENTQHQYTIQSSIDHPKVKLINGKSLHNVLTAELDGTRDALKQKEISHYTIKIEEINPANVTKLFLFLEALTILVARLIKVDPFDQPGVELGKILCLEHLKN